MKYHIGWVSWVFVRITDDQGAYGWGEGSLHGPIAPVLEAIAAYSSHLIGQEAFGAERHWHRLYNAWRWRGGAVYMTALSALDTALWDLEARRLGVPLYRLLGGPHRTELLGYASHWLKDVTTPDKAFAQAKEAVRRGFRGFKWSPFDFHRLRDDFQGSIAYAREMMAAAREGAGAGMEIYIECAEMLSPRTAPVMVDALLSYRPAWIEEPFPFENAKAIARLQSEISIPVAVGERLLSRFEFRELLECGGCRVVQPDVMHGGGVTELRRVASLAETYDVSIAPHNPGGPICMAASMHIAAASPNFLVLEQIEPDRELRDSASTNPPRFIGGKFVVTDAPGLGAEPNFEALKGMEAGELPRHERPGSLFS